VSRREAQHGDGRRRSHRTRLTPSIIADAVVAATDSSAPRSMSRPPLSGGRRDPDAPAAMTEALDEGRQGSEETESFSGRPVSGQMG